MIRRFEPIGIGLELNNSGDILRSNKKDRSRNPVYLCWCMTWLRGQDSNLRLIPFGLGSLYLNLHLLIVKLFNYFSRKSAVIIHFSRILNAGIVPRLALLAAILPATPFSLAHADKVMIFGADKRAIRL